MRAEAPANLDSFARLFGRGTPLRYAAAGLVNTGAGYATMIGLGAAGMAPYPANAAGFAAGFLVGAALSRAYTFGAPVRSSASWRYAASFGACYALNLTAVGVALTLGLPTPLAQAAGVGAYAVTFYLACRWWVFGAAGTAAADLAAARGLIGRSR